MGSVSSTKRTPIARTRALALANAAASAVGTPNPSDVLAGLGAGNVKAA